MMITKHFYGDGLESEAPEDMVRTECWFILLATSTSYMEPGRASFYIQPTPTNQSLTDHIWYPNIDVNLAISLMEHLR